MLVFPSGYTTIPSDYTGSIWLEGQIKQLEEAVWGVPEKIHKPVGILIGAQYAYATIKTDKRNLDVQLPAGKSAKAALLENAEELEKEALRKLHLSRVIREAAATLS